MKQYSQRVLVTTMVVVATAIASAQAGDFRLTSPDVIEGQPITAAQYSNVFGCNGANARPTLEWSGAPEGTKSYAVTFYDQDAPTGSGFWHWVLTDISATANGIAADADPVGSIEGNTDVGQPGYLGPCPPIGRKHKYVYTVHALDVNTLGVPEGATAALTGFYIFQHRLGKATLSTIAGPRDH
ncbi:MAG: YbhB/YbcL family Raf kinase inhibitor-like protein [Nitrospirales bacterium]